MSVDCAINLQLAGRLCVVVGAGRIGRHKAKQFLAAGASVRLIDPRGHAISIPEGSEVVSRAYRSGDLAGARLVVAATDRTEVNRQVAEDAHRSRILVSVVDDPAASDFSLPAVRQQGQLRLAVSTSGQSPALAGLVADRLFESLESGWDLAVELVGRLRGWQLTHPELTAYNRSLLRQLVDRGLVTKLSSHRYDLVDQLLTETCGAGCTLAALGIKHPREYDR